MTVKETILPKLKQRLRERVNDDSVAVVAEAARALEPLLSHAASRRPGKITSLTLKGARSLGGLTEDEGRLGRFHGRSMAIVFADLAEFTAYTAIHGDDAAVDLLDQVSRAVARVTARCHGEVVKNLGDGFLLVFSTSSRGTRAALALQEEMRRVEAKGDGVRMRIVVHEGRPTVEDDDVFGHDVNLTAHLLDHCKPGEVLVSSDAKERAERRSKKVTFDRKKRVKVQGVPDKTEVWRARPAPDLG